MTTHGDQIFQFGGVPVASNLGLLPANVFMVANEGSTKQAWLWWKNKWRKEKLFTSIETAYAKAVAGRNDVISLVPDYDGDLDASLTWAKNDTHFIGASLTPNQPHTDIWQGAEFTPMLTISSRGSVFANMTLRHGTTAADLIGTLISGRYNYFENIYWYTPLVAAQDVAGYVGVHITGHNNYFKGCHFGSEGTSRDQANSNVKIAGSGHVFEDCVFCMSADGVSPTFLEIDTADDRRYLIFKNCLFYVHWVNHADQITYAIKVTGAGATTDLIFDSRCMFVGVDYVSDAADDQHIWIATPGDTAATAASLLAVRNLGT